jgi:nucleoside-diphosphate-sugar epimerase
LDGPVLITGFGFVGKAVAAYLTGLGARVSVLDRHPDIARCAAASVRPLAGDVRDASLMKCLVPEFAGVIHTAGILGTSESVDDPAPSIETNLLGSVNVFQALRRAAALGRRVPCVYITCANWFMENSYAITKHAAHRFAEMFNREHGTDIRIVRAQNVYGEEQADFPVQKIIPRFISRALANEPLRVYGSGAQVQDMIYVRDVAAILAHALAAPQCGFDTISAGTGRRLTVLDIARMVIAAAGSSSRIEFVPMRAGEPEMSETLGEPESLLAIGYDPHSLTSFEAGLARTVEWHRARAALSASGTAAMAS